MNVGEVWISAIVAAELCFGAAKLGSNKFVTVIEAWLAGFGSGFVRPEYAMHKH